MNLLLVMTLSIAPAVLLAVVGLGVARRPRIIEGEARPALILAAHPDDCVILAGAYAIWARSADLRVQVMYLTCGAPEPNLPRADTRRREALAAWTSIGVAHKDIVFVDLPEHPVTATSSWTAGDRDGARARIAGLIGHLAPGSCVFLPAAGESHVDHRALRRLALEAWSATGRTDVSFFEGPEYNNYLSVLQSPIKVWATFIHALPGLSRVFRFTRPVWTGFASGARSWMLPPDPVRQTKRQDILRAFASENGDLLVRLFGHFERYRPVANPQTGLDEETPRGYFLLGGHRRGASAILALIVLFEMVACLSIVASKIGLSILGHGHAGIACVGAVALIAAALGFRRKIAPEARVFYEGIGAGAIAAIVIGG